MAFVLGANGKLAGEMDSRCLARFVFVRFIVALCARAYSSAVEHARTDALAHTAGGRQRSTHTHT